MVLTLCEAYFFAEPASSPQPEGTRNRPPRMISRRPVCTITPSHHHTYDGITRRCPGRMRLRLPNPFTACTFLTVVS